jgi:hypothetical protein
MRAGVRVNSSITDASTAGTAVLKREDFKTRWCGCSFP